MAKEITVKFGSSKVAISGTNKSEERRNVKKGQIALARTVERIVKPGVKLNVDRGVPLFHADSEHPGKIVRELDGRRSIGKFVNGKFKISR